MSCALRNFTAGLGASSASNADNSRASVMIRFSRCSCVIHPPFARHPPSERREHLAGDASSADFDMSFPRRLVDFDDQAPRTRSRSRAAAPCAARPSPAGRSWVVEGLREAIRRKCAEESPIVH
jgi:hypothetical protein